MPFPRPAIKTRALCLTNAPTQRRNAGSFTVGDKAREQGAAEPMKPEDSPRPVGEPSIDNRHQRFRIEPTIFIDITNLQHQRITTGFLLHPATKVIAHPDFGNVVD